MDDFADIRKLLESKREELSARLSKIKEKIRHADEPIEADFAEQAVQRENDEVLDAIGLATREEVSAISRALARIDSGDYGFCTQCGKPINPDRLKIRPYSDECVTCASQHE